jgi:hypothetical protein
MPLARISRMAERVERRGMRGVRGLLVAVVVMGVLIVAGLATVGVVIAVRISATPPAAQEAVLDEPAGTRIAGASALSDRLVLRLRGGGSDRVVMVDMRSGKVVGRVRLSQ